uniref:DUF4549 domain-containing protein n=1 Tax=Anguilla anguilla TaxID=7936 RepID=A0A0E9QGS3_ANGAN
MPSECVAYITKFMTAYKPIGVMAGVYRVCSTEKLKLMEKELSAQLSALRTEIEENGILDVSALKSYSSVPIPKDISYFRVEREQILQEGLEVRPFCTWLLHVGLFWVK